jgi:hypothetical protein
MNGDKEVLAVVGNRLAQSAAIFSGEVSIVNYNAAVILSSFGTTLKTIEADIATIKSKFISYESRLSNIETAIRDLRPTEVQQGGVPSKSPDLPTYPVGDAKKLKALENFLCAKEFELNIVVCFNYYNSEL